MVLLPIILHGTTALKTSVIFPFSLLFFNTRKCSSNRTSSKPLVILLAASETLHSLLSSSCPCRKGRTSTKYSKCWWTMYFHKVGWNGVFFPWSHKTYTFGWHWEWRWYMYMSVFPVWKMSFQSLKCLVQSQSQCLLKPHFPPSMSSALWCPAWKIFLPFSHLGLQDHKIFLRFSADMYFNSAPLGNIFCKLCYITLHDFLRSPDEHSSWQWSLPNCSVELTILLKWPGLVFLPSV